MVIDSGAKYIPTDTYIKDEDIRNHLRYVGNIFDSRDIMDL